MRPAAGVASRGLALRIAAKAVSRRAGGRGVALQNALIPKTAAVSFTANSNCSNYPPASTARQYHRYSSNNSNKDDGAAMRWMVLAMGSALALLNAAATSSEEATVASCSSSSSGASEKSSDGHRRLTKRISIVQEQEELDQGRPRPSSSSSSGAAKTKAAAAAVEEDATTAKDPGVALVVASTYNGNGPIEDRHNVRQSPRGDFFVSVLDGHGGWQAAEHARKRLNIAAQTELKSTLAKNPEQVLRCTLSDDLICFDPPLLSVFFLGRQVASAGAS